MKFHIGKDGEVKIIFVYKNTEKVEEANDLYSYLKEKELFKGDLGEVYSHISYSEDKFILLGIGEKEKTTANSLRKAFFNAGEELMKFKVTSIKISIPMFKNLKYESIVQSITEGLLQSEYSFEKYLTKKKISPSIKNVYLDILEEKKEETINAINESKNLIEGIFLARNLVNEPAIYMTPTALANNAKNQLESLGVEVKIYGKEKIKELGMEAFSAVSKGSFEEPQLIVMNYKGNSNSDKKLALVGKGLTYDSGGYSIKPTSSMIDMHSDMAGSASVIGAMKAIAMSKLEVNVVAIVAACENMISGGAYKPGDIISSMSGKTIEVLNTDAEGRLTLADALWYAVDVVKADKIIDIATLTGACVTALGSINTGAITNNSYLMDNVKKASECAGEPVWEFPNNDEYKELIKGTFGDLKNSSGREAGAITAGMFLQEFVGNTPWVHLDVAGTAYLSSKNGYLPKGATGVPVKTLYYLAKGFKNK